MERIRSALSDILNGGIGAGDPRAQDRALMRRVQTLNGFSLSQAVICVLLIFYLGWSKQWSSLALSAFADPRHLPPANWSTLLMG